jgi:hypothetical protein
MTNILVERLSTISCSQMLDEDELAEWKETLKMAVTAESPEKKMMLMKPDDARPLYTAFAVDQLETYLPCWEKLADAILNKGKHTPTEQDIVSKFKSLLRKPEVLVDLALTVGFFRGYFFSHFKFLQGVDPNIGTPGFRQFHIFVRVFLMHKDLDHLAQYQNESQPEMEPCIERVSVSVLLAGAEQDKQHWKADQFFNFAKSENIKMCCAKSG